MTNIEGHRKPRGSKWLVHFMESWKFDTDDLIGVDRNDVLKILDKEWFKVTKIVKKVETELLKHKAEFQQHLE